MKYTKQYKVEGENVPELIINKGKCFMQNADGTTGKFVGERVIISLPDVVDLETDDHQDDIINPDMYDGENGIYINLTKTQAFKLAKSLLILSDIMEED